MSDGIRWQMKGQMNIITNIQKCGKNEQLVGDW
jgi:hypothetical protein